MDKVVHEWTDYELDGKDRGVGHNGPLWNWRIIHRGGVLYFPQLSRKPDRDWDEPWGWNDYAESFFAELARLAERNKKLEELVDAAEELRDIVDGIYEGDDYKIDSFTTQPITAALKDLK